MDFGRGGGERVYYVGRVYFFAPKKKTGTLVLVYERRCMICTKDPVKSSWNTGHNSDLSAKCHCNVSTPLAKLPYNYRELIAYFYLDL